MALERTVTEDPVPEEYRSDIIDHLFPNRHSICLDERIQIWEAYFRYYTSECRKAVEFEYGEHTTIRKHEDVGEVARELKNNRSKEDIKMRLCLLDTQKRSDTEKDQMAEGTVRLVVRLIAMIDIGPIPQSRISGRDPLQWSTEHASLRELLKSQFFESSLDPDSIKFGDDFTALNLVRFAGIKIKWTNNLVDHLRLVDNDQTLRVFHQATFLKAQNNSIYPQGFVEETLRTLAILFPRSNKKVKKWLNGHLSSSDEFILDSGLLNCNRVKPDERLAKSFRFWRDRLISLNDMFEKPRHSSIIQSWHDRRNKSQWYTFWIAVLILLLTLFFGMAQTILSALQVYKAYHPAGDRLDTMLARE